MKIAATIRSLFAWRAAVVVLFLMAVLPQMRADEISGFTVDFSNGTPPLTYTSADGSLIYSPMSSHAATFEFYGNQPGVFASLYFSAPQDLELTPGLYTNVARFPFQGADQAGLWIAVNGSGPNSVTGEFTVLEAVYGADGSIEHFGATYEQFIDFDTTAPWVGTVYYNYDVPVPEPSSLTYVAIVCLFVAGSLRVKRPSLKVL